MAIYSDVNQFDPHITKPVLEDAEPVYQSIFNILSTRRGERLFRPAFGSDVRRILHKLITAGTELELWRETIEAISIAESRAVVDNSNTNIRPNADITGEYDADLAFRIRGLTERSFRFRSPLNPA